MFPTETLEPAISIGKCDCRAGQMKKRKKKIWTIELKKALLKNVVGKVIGWWKISIECCMLN
jgi:hypothetical protein